MRQLVQTNGTILDALTYDSYGNILTETNSANGDRFKYTSREWDSEIGLQFNRARYYDPKAGRWIGEDPAKFKARDANLYRYVRNSPLKIVDPSGLFKNCLEERRDCEDWAWARWNGCMARAHGNPFLEAMCEVEWEDDMALCALQFEECMKQRPIVIPSPSRNWSWGTQHVTAWVTDTVDAAGSWINDHRGLVVAVAAVTAITLVAIVTAPALIAGGLALGGAIAANATWVTATATIAGSVVLAQTITPMGPG